MSKVAYFTRSLARAADPNRRECPNCGGKISEMVERKFVVTALRRCASCKLMFRTPTDRASEAADFYNSSYAEGFTTTMPSPDELARLKTGDWPSEKDYSRYISVLRDLGVEDSSHLFDFGCSWGYGSYQLAKAGFDVLSYEISRPRADYATRHLGVRLVPDFEAWATANPRSLDGFFSAHVLEHVPSPSRIIEFARKALKPGGLFIAFVPNGSSACREALPEWSQLWGEVHPNLLDDLFLEAAIPDRPRIFASTPAKIARSEADWLSERSAGCRRLNALAGSELLFAFRN